jgi:RimJ/RimL family protein N-acetyltransferase
MEAAEHSDVPGSLSVREMEAGDIPLITDYWLNAAPGYLLGMGVDLLRMPSRDQWLVLLSAQLRQEYYEKQSYCMIWQLEGKPVGHCNVNRILFGEEAYMHLHIWFPSIRKMRLGNRFVKMTLPYFFENLQLQTLCCEPYALNPAPNKLLEKAGFVFVKEYTTIPGALNFEQPVNHWEISKSRVEAPVK